MSSSAVTARMSFIGRRPINFKKSEVQLRLQEFTEKTMVKGFGKLPFSHSLYIDGKLGKFTVSIVDGLRCNFTDGFSAEESRLVLEIDGEKFNKFNKYQQKFLKSMHGTTNSLVTNYIEGVTEGHNVSLKLVGVGYRANLDGCSLVLRVGFSHPIKLPIPEGISVKVPIQTKIVLSGSDYQQLTQFAALIRSKRPPEPYNGKGIFVGNEEIIRKEGKKTK